MHRGPVGGIRLPPWARASTDNLMCTAAAAGMACSKQSSTLIMAWQGARPAFGVVLQPGYLKTTCQRVYSGAFWFHPEKYFAKHHAFGESGPCNSQVDGVQEQASTMEAGGFSETGAKTSTFGLLSRGVLFFALGRPCAAAGSRAAQGLESTGKHWKVKAQYHEPGMPRFLESAHTLNRCLDDVTHHVVIFVAGARQ